MKFVKQLINRLPLEWWRRWWEQIYLITAGGAWSVKLSSVKRRSLRWLLFSGVFFNISDSILGTYQSVYLLALGASRGEIGLLNSLLNLSMPVAMLPGAYIAERGSSYKKAVVIPSALGRVLLLGVVFLPFLPDTNSRVVLCIVLLVLQALLANLSNPAWTASVGAVVPLRWRGRYFSSRNIWMGLAAFIILNIAGYIIDNAGELQGYQIILFLAVLAGWLGAWTYSKVEQKQKKTANIKVSAAKNYDFWQQLKGEQQFLIFCGTAFIWNFFVQIAGPFFIVALAETTQASAVTIGFVSAVSTLAALPGQRIFGSLSERKGSEWIQQLTGFLVPIVPAVWGFITQPWQAFPVQILSGFSWAGYHLAVFNLLLKLTPDEGRSNFVAFYQALVGIGMAGGAALGGWIATVYGYRDVFLISAAGRFFAAGLFALMINPERLRSWGAWFRRQGTRFKAALLAFIKWGERLIAMLAAFFIKIKTTLAEKRKRVKKSNRSVEVSEGDESAEEQEPDVS
ncbi:MAG: MFS transporter [Anaerolineae bacterium]|nr:MFS transporter [Anaerolineae bacterium]